MRNMKRAFSLLVALAVVLPFLAFGQTSNYYERSYARMSYVQGDVYVQRAGDQGYDKGEINLVVVQGDKLGSRSGRLEIQLGQRNYLRLDNDTQIDLASLPGRDGDPTKLHILAGSLFLRVQSLDRPKNYEVHTPDGSFYILTAGLYRVDVRENRETEFSVLSGSAEAAGESGSVTVEDGQRISAADGRFTSETGSLLARRDDFAAWNESREALYARQTTGRSYLPAQYADYEAELADNGSWVDEPEYGSVWVPRGVYSDWRPYSNGRWVWYPIIGWTWVPYESWGWCTHHYGRWGWRLNLGWYWIPRDHWGWGPAWVNWWNDDYYVGWCPLSYWGYPAVIYNNRFYGRYRFGEYDRYDHFRHSMTVVERNRLWDRNVGRAALGADRLSGHLSRVALSDRQPALRGGLDRGDAVSARAASVLGRENLRSSVRSFSGGARLSSDELRSSVRSGAAGSRTIREGLVSESRSLAGRGESSSSTARRIRSYPSGGSGLDSARGTAIRERSASASSSGARSIREYGSTGRNSSGSISRSVSGRTRDESGATMRSYPSRTTDSSSGRSSSARSYSPSRESGSSRSSSSLREYGSRSSSGTSSRSYGAPSRSYSSPSRSYSSGSSSSSRSYSAPSRSYSSPSRSYSSGSSSSSRSYSAPSRSYSAPSRSYSSPSRSYSSGSSSSSRSYSAPSRSYSSGSSSSSRSYSAPSRSSGSSSRSSGSGSSSRSSSSSGRSSSGSSRRR